MDLIRREPRIGGKSPPQPRRNHGIARLNHHSSLFVPQLRERGHALVQIRPCACWIFPVGLVSFYFIGFKIGILFALRRWRT